MGSVGQVASESASTAAAPDSSPAERVESPGTRLRGGRVTGLDGLRAVAVLAVMLYHAGVSWIPGGMLGVDVFFVISGFLITSLLVDERARSGRISLGNFWLRRVRRLLPAVVLLLCFVAVTWGLFLHDDVYSLRNDILAALGYSANWWFASSGQGYFAAYAAPSPVLHLWSLSVEEQFYLFWPLVVTALLARGRRVGRWAAGGAVLAAIATLAQSLAGIWTDRLYYGTDTRAAPLLVGAALGAWYTTRPAHFRLSVRAKVAVQIAGAVAAAGVLWAFGNVDGQSTSLYRGGFLLLAIAVAGVIASVSLAPAGPLSRALSVSPVRYIGRISYGLYLWHWPLFLLLNHARTGLSGRELLALRFAATFVIAVLSFHLVEQPIRERRWSLPRPRITAPVALAALLGLLFAATPGTTSPVSDPAASQLNGPAAGSSPAAVGTAPAIAGREKILIAGDSVALSLANGLIPEQAQYKVQIDNGGLLGCGVARGGPSRFRDKLYDLPSFCATWPQLRAQQLAKAKPDLVALLVGRWEVLNRQWNGRWTHIGDPAFDAYLASELDRAIDVLSATGKRVALLTLPCVQPKESADGTPYPEDQPQRIDRFNQLLRAAQARHPKQSVIVDLYSMVCPGGHFTATMDGVTIRSEDGAHFPGTAIPPVAAKLLPVLYRLASAGTSPGK